MCPPETHASMQCSWKSKSPWYGQAQHSGLLYHCWDSLHPDLTPRQNSCAWFVRHDFVLFVSLSKCPNVPPKCVHALPFQLQGKLRERANLLLLLPLLLLLLIILCSLLLFYSATMSWLPIKASSPWKKQLFPFYFWLHDWHSTKCWTHICLSPLLGWHGVLLILKKDSRDDDWLIK